MTQTATQLYTTDAAFLARYVDYQNRYAVTIRESDKVLIDRSRMIRAT